MHIAEKEVVDLLSLETSKISVGKALDNLVYLSYYPWFDQNSGLIVLRDLMEPKSQCNSDAQKLHWSLRIANRRVNVAHFCKDTVAVSKVQLCQAGMFSPFCRWICAVSECGVCLTIVSKAYLLLQKHERMNRTLFRSSACVYSWALLGESMGENGLVGTLNSATYWCWSARRNELCLFLWIELWIFTWLYAGLGLVKFTREHRSTETLSTAKIAFHNSVSTAGPP